MKRDDVMWSGIKRASAGILTPQALVWWQF